MTEPSLLLLLLPHPVRLLLLLTESAEPGPCQALHGPGSPPRRPAPQRWWRLWRPDSLASGVRARREGGRAREGRRMREEGGGRGSKDEDEEN